MALVSLTQSAKRSAIVIVMQACSGDDGKPLIGISRTSPLEAGEIPAMKLPGRCSFTELSLRMATVRSKLNFAGIYSQELWEEAPRDPRQAIDSVSGQARRSFSPFAARVQKLY